MTVTAEPAASVHPSAPENEAEHTGYLGRVFY